jgi:serine phosphatase RsbU (regulator of sigma subunit)
MLVGLTQDFVADNPKHEGASNIAREIQQARLPRGFRDFPHLVVTGIHSPCLAVGGEYFDAFSLGDDRIAFLIAKV